MIQYTTKPQQDAYDTSTKTRRRYEHSKRENKKSRKSNKRRGHSTRIGARNLIVKTQNHPSVQQKETKRNKRNSSALNEPWAPVNDERKIGKKLGDCALSVKTKSRPI